MLFRAPAPGDDARRLRVFSFPAKTVLGLLEDRPGDDGEEGVRRLAAHVKQCVPADATLEATYTDYREGDTSFILAHPSFEPVDRLVDAPRFEPTDTPFRVGDRVVLALGVPGRAIKTVVGAGEQMTLCRWKCRFEGRSVEKAYLNTILRHADDRDGEAAEVTRTGPDDPKLEAKAEAFAFALAGAEG